MATTYPSIPIPADNMDSLYQSCLAMRQTIQLLIVNAQNVTNQTLTQASQVFTKKSDHTDAISTLNANVTTLTKTLTNISQSISTMQSQITTLQNQVAALQATGSNAVTGLETRMTTAEGNITNLQGRVTTLENKFPQTSAMEKVITPFTTTSTTYVMMGVNLTALADGTQAIVIMDGQLANSTNNQSTNVIICYGTGTPPVAGVARTGTVLTQSATYEATTGGGATGSFSLAGIITGLTIGQTYWFDLAAEVTGGTGTVSNVDVMAHIIA